MLDHDPGTVATVMMSASFGYLGALSIWEMDAEKKELTFTYRVLIPGEIDDPPRLVSACIATAFGAQDLKDELRRLHEEP